MANGVAELSKGGVFDDGYGLTSGEFPTGDPEDLTIVIGPRLLGGRERKPREGRRVITLSLVGMFASSV